jgi:3-oxoacyl-[acyl-carrier-protein] synthase-3
MNILGAGMCLGETSIDNEALATFLPPEIVQAKTGIVSRKRSTRTTGALAIDALRAAVADAGLSIADLRTLILSTNSGDSWVPSTATAIAKAVGLRAPAIEINAACSGGLYALRLAAGLPGPVAVVASETVSRYMANTAGDWPSVIFGDGAAAVILDTPFSIPGCAWGTEPDGRDWMVVEGGIGRMQGRPLFEAAIRLCSEGLLTACAEAGYRLVDLDWIVPHQANLRVLEAIAEELKYPMARVIQTVPWTGNMSSASMLVALVHGLQAGLLQNDQKIGYVAFGAGITWGALICTLHLQS